MPKKFFLLLMTVSIILTPAVFADVQTEVLFKDSFESYGVGGSGADENGKAVNPVVSDESGSAWFNAEASAKRGVLVFGEPDTDNHYLALYKQNNIQKTDFSAKLEPCKIYGNRQYVFSSRIYLPKYSNGSAGAAGCGLSIYASGLPLGENGLKLADFTADKNGAAVILGGFETGKTAGLDKWYELKTVISFDGEKTYITSYIDGNLCAFYEETSVSASEIVYLNISLDLNNILDTRSKPVVWFDDIELSVSELPETPLTASFSPKSGAMTAKAGAPLTVEFNDEISPVTADDITVDNGAFVSLLEMNGSNTGFYAEFGSLKEGTKYNVSFNACRPGEEPQQYTYNFTYTGNKEVYVYDWFNTYGVDGSGLDETGKGINPITAQETFGKWYDKEAAPKRGAIIAQNEDNIPALNFYLQSQNKVTKTDMSTLLRADKASLGEPSGVYELNTEFMIPYGSGSIKSVGLRDDCYMETGLYSAEGRFISLFKIDYADGKNRIMFLDSEKSAPLSENRKYSVKLLIYPKDGGYTADAFVSNEQILNREPVSLNGFSEMNRLSVGVHGYDSPNVARMFALNGIEFKCCFTPKLVSCDSAFKKLPAGNAVVTVSFDTPASDDPKAYSISDDAQITDAELTDEYTAKLFVSGLKNGNTYTLGFEGIKNDDGYGCLDTAVFEVVKKIEVTDISLSGGGLTSGQNTVTAKIKNTTAEKLCATLIVLVCEEKDGDYRIKSVVTAADADVSADDSITADFSLESTEKRFVRVLLIDSADGMNVLCDEVTYN